MDCSLPGPSVHGILQARILEWIAISSPGDLPNPGLPHCRQILDHLFFFFNFLKISFNWRLITLQYCTGFCHTLTWISRGCTCIITTDNYFKSYSFPGGSDGKESACSAGDWGSIPGLGRPLEREWQSIPVFLPGEFHRQRSLAGYSPWCHKESDMTEPTNTFTC